MKIKSLLILLFSFVFSFSFSQENLTPHENHVHKIDPNRHSSSSTMLIENKGQWPEGVLFRSKMEGGNVWVQQHKFVYHLQDYSAMYEAHAMKNPGPMNEEIKETVVHLNFIGSNRINNVANENPSKEYFNYFLGNDKSKWASGVHGYGKSTLNSIYNNIDLRILGDKNEFKYEFIVHPGGDKNSITMNYVGQKGLKIDDKGNLSIETELGRIVEYKPYAYQMIDGKENKVKCDFQLIGKNVKFKLGSFNKDYDLIIDPTLIFSTYVGAFSDNFGMTATYGNDGTAYSGGTVYGNNYPTPDNQAYDINSNFTVLNAAYGITDVFISKYSADGTQMIWGTFVGGGNNTSGTETVHSMICDAQDNLYFFGATSSADFPTTPGAYDTGHNGGNTTYNTNFYYNGVYFQNLGTDIYVAKLSANGQNLLGSTFVGGSANDGVNYEQANLTYNSVATYSGLISNYGDQMRGEIMLDDANNVLVASCTRSSNFPTVSPVQASIGGMQDGVVFELSADFSALNFSTYYGGSQMDACYSVKVDNSQNILFAGGTESNNLIGTAGGYQPASDGNVEGFVVKLPPAGNSITQASYIGKGGYDQVFFVEYDRNDNVFLLGQSVGSNGNGYIPVVNAAYSNGNSSNFIMKLDPTLTTNLNSTRFGNGSTSIHLSPAAFLVDNCGNIYVSGWGANILQSTPLNGMPVTSDAFQSTPPNGYDFYLFVLKGDFNSLLYGSYIGGTIADEHVDGGTSRFDKNGVVYQSVCAGCGGSSDFPTTADSGNASPWSSVNNSTNCNNVVYKFSTGLMPVADFIPDQTVGCNDFSVTFDNFSSDDDTWLWDFGDGQLDSTTFEPIILYTTPGEYTVNLYVTDSVCLLTDTAQITITVIDSIQLNVASPIDICGSSPYTLTADANGTGDYFIWSTSPTMTPALNAPADSSIVVTTSGTYYIEVGNAYCNKVDTVVVNFIDPPTISLDPITTQSCAPLENTYQVNVTSADSIIWDFGGVSTITTGDEISTQTFAFDQPGNYVISVSAFNEICPSDASTSISVTVLDTISISTLNPIYICNSDPYTIVANISGSPTNIIWSDQPDFSTQLNDGPNDNDIIVSTSGIYYVAATNGFCSDTSFSEITFDSPSQASFTPSNFLGCEPLTVTFDNTSVQTDEFLWDFGNSTVDSINFEPSITYNQAGQYSVSLIIFDPECPAQDTAIFIINVLPDVISEVQDTITLCASVPVTISANTFGTANEFVWSSSNLFSDTLNSATTDSTVNLSNPVEGYYYFNASNGSCEIVDSVLILFSELEIDLNAPDSICSDETTTVTAINLNPGVNYTYTWSPQNIILNSNENQAEVQLTSSQFVYVTGEYNGCFATDSIFINVSVLDPTQVMATASAYVVSPGTTVTLFGNPNGMDAYTWTPDNGLFSPNSQNTDAFIEDDIIYTLTVDLGVCTREDTVEIKVYEVICDDPYVFIPNAFSPNGDGENDILYVRGIWIEEMIFRVFDRWGELVFESTDPQYGWDGTFRGRELDPDVYDFYLDVTCVGGLKSITKGNVTLMR